MSDRAYWRSIQPPPPKKPVTFTAVESAADFAPKEVTVPFTTGDTIQRVTVSDVAILATDKIVCSVRRGTIDPKDDLGHIYVVNVVSQEDGGFDAIIACCDIGFGDTTMVPPNETVTLVYTNSA